MSWFSQRGPRLVIYLAIVALAMAITSTIDRAARIKQDNRITKIENIQQCKSDEDCEALMARLLTNALPGQLKDVRGAQGRPGRHGKNGRDGKSIQGPRGLRGRTGAQGVPGRTGVVRSHRGPQGPSGVKEMVPVIENLKKQVQDIQQRQRLVSPPQGQQGIGNNGNEKETGNACMQNPNC